MMGDKLYCPQPMIWNEIHKKLLKARKDNENIPKPPIPLILAAWWETTLFQKYQRWQETIDWAKKYGFSDLIPDLKEEELNFE